MYTYNLPRLYDISCARIYSASDHKSIQPPIYIYIYMYVHSLKRNNSKVLPPPHGVPSYTLSISAMMNKELVNFSFLILNFEMSISEQTDLYFK